jgi:ornithine decarboxylase
MSTTEILPTQTRLQADFSSSYSVTSSDSVSRIFCDHQTPSWDIASPTITANTTTSTPVEDNNDHSLVVENGDGPIFPSLPPLLRGHPDVHLRNGILKAKCTEEADAERAFFVADLGVVYEQHQRWKQCLPDIQPFYGGLFDLKCCIHLEIFFGMM